MYCRILNPVESEQTYVAAKKKLSSELVLEFPWSVKYVLLDTVWVDLCERIWYVTNRNDSIWCLSELRTMRTLLTS